MAWFIPGQDFTKGKGERMKLRFLDFIEEYILVISLSVMAIINFGNVISRNFLSASWAFTEEITINLFVLNSFVGAAIAAKRGSHLGLSFLTDKIPQKYQKFVTLFACISAVVLFGYLARHGIIMAQRQHRFGQTTPALGIPEWIMGSMIPFGSFLLIIRFINLGINQWLGKEE